jgi:hypothetical protein
MRTVLISMMSLLIAGTIFAHSTYTGYSGAPGRQTCASSCHGSSGGTVTAVGFPATYAPGQQYQITLRHSGGSTIQNFNASVRIGTGSSNAGTIMAGMNCGTYNVSGETNGVHLSSTGRDSALFMWTAPAAGTGAVKLYVGAHQSSSASGANTTIQVTAQEAASAPGLATNPYPADNATNVGLYFYMRWTAGSGATSHDVYIRKASDPEFVYLGNFPADSAFCPDSAAGTLYEWHVDERNAAGVTTGTVWRFTTQNAVENASNPIPANGATNVAVATALNWTSGANEQNYDLLFGLTNPPTETILQNSTTPPPYQPADHLLGDTMYFWRIIERNSFGSILGPVWSFSTEHVSAISDHAIDLPRDFILGPVYPNPFNATVSIPFVLPKASHVRLTLTDITGRVVQELTDGNYAAGEHRLSWTSEGVASGLYFLRLQTDLGLRTAKVVALK